MTWPQVVMVTLMLLGLAGNVTNVTKDRTKSSDRATVAILLYIAYYIAFAGLLRAGGFW